MSNFVNSDQRNTNFHFQGLNFNPRNPQDIDRWGQKTRRTKPYESLDSGKFISSGSCKDSFTDKFDSKHDDKFTTNFDDGQCKLFVDINSNHASSSNINQKRISMEDLINYIKININAMNDSHLSNDNEDNEVLEIKEADTYTFTALQPNISKQIVKFPNNLNIIFFKYISDMSRIGVMVGNIGGKDKYNISLIASVLTCIKDDFMIQQLQTQQLYVSQLNNNLIGFINSNKYSDFRYNKMGFKQNDIITQIKFYQNTRIILRILADYFEINIFLLNISTDQLLISNDNNKFKKSILLMLLNDDTFEPIFYKNIKNLNYNQDIIKYLHENKFYQKLIDCPEIESEDGLDKYMNKTPNKNINLTIREKKLLRLLNNDRTKENINDDNNNNNNNELMDQKKQEDSIQPIENDVEGINEIMECSEESDRIIPDLSESDNIDVEINKNKSDINSSESEDTDMLPELLANHEKLKKYDEYLISQLKAKSYDESKRKLDDLQYDATLLGISVTIEGKNGKQKRKTKKELMDDIVEIIMLASPGTVIKR